MLDLHYNGNQLPENKSLLCEEILKNSIRWNREYINPEQVNNILSFIAELSYYTTYVEMGNRDELQTRVNEYISRSGFSDMNELSRHLINNSAIIENIDRKTLTIRFVHNSFLEFCTAWHMSTNKKYKEAAELCGKAEYREILQFYIYQEEQLTTFIKNIQDRITKNPESNPDIVKSLYWILEIINSCTDEKISRSVYTQLDKQLKDGFESNTPLFIDVHLHLRLSKLLSSDPIDKDPVYFKEWEFLAMKNNENKFCRKGILTGLNKIFIEDFLTLLNNYYDLREGSFDLPEKSTLPYGFYDDAIVKYLSKYSVCNPESRRFSIIRKKIENEVINDFSAFKEGVLRENDLHSGLLYPNRKVSKFVSELMNLWSPNIIIRNEYPDIHMTQKKLYKQYEEVFFPQGAKSRADASRNDSALCISRIYKELDIHTQPDTVNVLENIFVTSLDPYIVRPFNENCLKYLEEKTKELLARGVIETWGKIYLSYKSPFHNRISRSYQ